MAVIFKNKKNIPLRHEIATIYKRRNTKSRTRTTVHPDYETAFHCLQSEHNASFLEGIKSVCIQKIDSKNSIHIATRIGGESPLHAGSSSRVLLAYAPEAVRVSVISSPLKRYTPFTITSPEELSKSLFEIRRTRCCSSIEEINPGAGSVSCAILDEGNNLLAALSIIGTRFACETEGALWKALLLEAVKKVKLA